MKMVLNAANWALLAVLAVSTVQARAQASATGLLPTSGYAGLVVFGDSLADSGNNARLVGTDPTQQITGDGYFASLPFATGRYSNGPVWVEHLAERLGLSASASQLGGSNFAYGGAATGSDGTGTPIPGFPFSMRSQLGQYLATVPMAGTPAPAQSLFVLSGGSVNVSAAMEAAALHPEQAFGILSVAAQAYAFDIAAMVDGLQAAGAEHILVLNVPNFGLTPRAQSYGPQVAALGSLAAGLMNDALGLALNTEPGVRVFDLYGSLNQVVAHGSDYGLGNVSQACGALINACDPATALFYDGQHPTAYGHRLIADLVFSSAVPEPSSAVLLLLGGVCVLVRRRRQAEPA
ncbi:SGNH/GDSL hydrolase family protein [Paucibacter sp. DJ1R-11]|uniref:SGNH/GDSL hydrolase family protein n=1 Tax=Paucibacter sp. DJ1R-11 TaxID=2893556 RepID=UPI0021E45002|nr:SGNH/GDSL hydrolase family protein [Paucibacter sp. DJ1R-11]MCV2365380.1 SGNH/GDSL hydrolase family protein [Paucibacter sp. DJ1R-11]